MAASAASDAAAGLSVRSDPIAPAALGKIQTTIRPLEQLASALAGAPLRQSNRNWGPARPRQP